MPKDHQRADAVVFHWIESVCIVYVFPVYYPPDDYIEPELYSFMSEKCYSRGNKVTYSYSMFYDDNYDIQDCSTIEISGGFVLDTEKLRLYYDDPYGYEQQADQ